MNIAAQSQRPDRTVRAISKTGDLKCVRLVLAPPAPEDSTAEKDADTKLLRTYSPEFVILPEVNGKSARPYPKGEQDYQPHAVDVYFSSIGSVRQVPRGWLGVLNVIVTGVGYALLAIAVVLALGGAEGSLILTIGGAAILLAAVAFVFALAWRYVRTPHGSVALRDIAKLPDHGSKYATTVFPAAGAGSPEQAWSQYRELIETWKPPRTVYGRVRRDGGLTVLQYWLFYYYNDWWNQHEADWEVAMVFLDDQERPVTVACSSHLAGAWRSWEATEPVGADKRHPMVYVARGSHALYFSAAEGVHDAVLHQPWAIFDVQGRLTVRGQQDSVGRPERGDEPYQLRVIPAGAEALAKEDPRWDDWWWLQFAGRWGAKDGILSPAIQDGGLRWNNPTIWAKCVCEADSTSWREVVGGAGG